MTGPEPMVKPGEVITLTRRPKQSLPVFYKQPGRTAELDKDGVYTMVVHSVGRCYLPETDPGKQHSVTVCPECVHWWWAHYVIGVAAYQPWETEMQA